MRVRLDLAGVKHYPDLGAHSLAGHVSAEADTNHTVRTVSAVYLAPDNTELRASLGSLCLQKDQLRIGNQFDNYLVSYLVDVCDALAEVELSTIYVFNTFHLNQRRLVVCVLLTTE